MICIRTGAVADTEAIQAVERSAGELFRGTHMDWAVGDVTDAEGTAKCSVGGGKR